MKYPFISDSHTHTHWSPDADNPASLLCERAARLGFYSITVTDHCECNAFIKDGYQESICRSFEESQKASALFRGRVRVYSGIELGQATQDRAAAEHVLSLCNFDFVLGSLHNISQTEDFYFLDYGKVDVTNLLKAYFSEMQELVEWGNFDSLAHLTYPLRYIVGDHGIPVSLEPFWEQIDSILKQLAEKGKALEVNTSGLRQKIGETLPPLSVLKRFRELGGQYVTLGSDAHRWADVGAGIERGLTLLQEAGFRYFAVYQNREPKMLPVN